MVYKKISLLLLPSFSLIFALHVKSAALSSSGCTNMSNSSNLCQNIRTFRAPQKESCPDCVVARDLFEFDLEHTSPAIKAFYISLSHEDKVELERCLTEHKEIYLSAQEQMSQILELYCQASQQHVSYKDTVTISFYLDIIKKPTSTMEPRYVAHADVSTCTNQRSLQEPIACHPCPRYSDLSDHDKALFEKVNADLLALQARIQENLDRISKGYSRLKDQFTKFHNVEDATVSAVLGLTTPTPCSPHKASVRGSSDSALDNGALATFASSLVGPDRAEFDQFNKELNDLYGSTGAALDQIFNEYSQLNQNGNDYKEKIILNFYLDTKTEESCYFAQCLDQATKSNIVNAGITAQDLGLCPHYANLSEQDKELFKKLYTDLETLVKKAQKAATDLVERHASIKNKLKEFHHLDDIVVNVSLALANR
jgi:hypothetical protein